MNVSFKFRLDKQKELCSLLQKHYSGISKILHLNFIVSIPLCTCNKFIEMSRIYTT